jgi:hypothetical protein
MIALFIDDPLSPKRTLGLWRGGNITPLLRSGQTVQGLGKVGAILSARLNDRNDNLVIEVSLDDRPSNPFDSWIFSKGVFRRITRPAPKPRVFHWVEEDGTVSRGILSAGTVAFGDLKLQSVSGVCGVNKSGQVLVEAHFARVGAGPGGYRNGLVLLSPSR